MHFRQISHSHKLILSQLASGVFCALCLCAPTFAGTPDAPEDTVPAKHSQATLLVQSSPLAGSQFHELPDLVSQIRVGAALTLKRDPTNPHDKNAIQVLWQGHMLGFVPRRENRAVAHAMDRGDPLVARVVALRPDESPWRRLRFEISMRLSD